MSHPQLIYNAYVMHINCGIMLIMMNNAMCPPRWSSGARGNLFDYVPDLMVFDVRGDSNGGMLDLMSIPPDESLSNSGHPRDCHVRSDISHSTTPPSVVASH